MLKYEEGLIDLENRFNEAYQFILQMTPQLIDAVRYGSTTSNGLNILYSYQNSNMDQTYNLHTSFVQMLCDKRSSQLHSLLLPMGQRWVELYNDDDKQEFNDIDSEKLFLILQKSNLHSIIGSVLNDVNIGTGAIWIDTPSKDKPLVFKPITGISIIPEYADDCENKNVWFKRAIGCDKTNNLNEDQNFLTCGFIYNRDENNKPIYKTDDNTNEWLYIECLDDDFKNPITYASKKYKHLHLLQDTIRSGDTRGTGIILKCLNDIRYLNELNEGEKDLVRMMYKPNILTSPELKNFVNYKNIAGKVFPNTLGRNGQPLIKFMEINAQLNEIIVKRNDLQTLLEQAFNVMPFGTMEDSTVRSATEIELRSSEAQRESTTDISRLTADLDNMFKTVVMMLKDKNIIGKNVKEITLKNPMLLAENQNRLNNLISAVQILGQVIAPEIKLATYDPIQLDKYIKTLLGIPTYLNASDEQLSNVKQVLQQMMQPQPTQNIQQPNAVDPSQLGQGNMAQRQGLGL